MLRHSSLSNHKNVNFLRTKYWKREEQRLVMVDSPEGLYDAVRTVPQDWREAWHRGPGDGNANGP